MALVSDLIVSVMQLMGALTQGETPNTDEQTSIFNRLNELIDAWNTDRLNIFTVQSALYGLVASKGTYQIGPGAADFNVARPVNVETAHVVSGAGIRSKMDMLNSLEWAAIKEKTVQALMPYRFYYDAQFPIANINIWPQPSLAAGGATNIELFTWQPLAAFASVSSVVSLPPAYLKAIRYNLAVDLAPDFGLQLQPQVAPIATASKQEMRMLNAQILPGPLSRETYGDIPEHGFPGSTPTEQQQSGSTAGQQATP